LATQKALLKAIRRAHIQRDGIAGRQPNIDRLQAAVARLISRDGTRMQPFGGRV